MMKLNDKVNHFDILHHLISHLHFLFPMQSFRSRRRISSMMRLQQLASCRGGASRSLVVGVPQKPEVTHEQNQHVL